MPHYAVGVDGGKAQALRKFRYPSEGGSTISPQEIIAANPCLITDLEQLGLLDEEIVLSMTEYPTGRGPVDVLIITASGEIVIVECKLIRNPESSRSVVAQVIDYVKAFCSETQESLLKKSRDDSFRARLTRDSRLSSLVEQNLRTGNFRVVIVGDDIHPNVLGMVDSIQSAPHLSFTVYLVEMAAYGPVHDSLYVYPLVVASTVEVERSVIRIEVEPEQLRYRGVSRSPDKAGKGPKPMLSWEEYLSSVADPDFRAIIADFKNRWLTVVEESLSMGQVGFSLGVTVRGRRVAIQFVYGTQVAIISPRTKETGPILEAVYQDYIADLQSLPAVYDMTVAANRVHAPFDSMDATTLRRILDAGLQVAIRLKESASPSD